MTPSRESSPEAGPMSTANDTNSTRSAALRNLFVRCPDGQTICLGVDPRKEGPSSIKHRIIENWTSSPEEVDSQRQQLCMFVMFSHILSVVSSYVQQCRVEDELYLTWNGKVIDDLPKRCGLGETNSPMTLADYNLTKDNATIHASVRTRGGCFMVSLSLLTIICGALMMSVFTCGGSLLIVPFLVPFLFILPFFCL